MRVQVATLRDKARPVNLAMVEPMERRVLLTGTVSGTVYNDSNGNGEHDAGETGAASITIFDDVNNDRVLDDGEVSTVTDSTGAYTLTNVPVGAAIIRESIPAGVAQTAPANQWGQHLTVTNGATINAVNFEQVIALGTISGTVYNDVNQNGKLDAGETGLPDWAVYIDLGNVGHYVVGDPVPLTNAAGQYTFMVGAPATYIIRVFAPAGNEQTAPALNFGQHITVGAGKNVTGVNFGFYQFPTGTASISGTVMLADGSPAPAGWTVYLDTNNNFKFDNGEITTVTTSTGSYLFSGLGAGIYIARVITPIGYEQVTPARNYGDHVTLASGAVVTGENFTFKSTSTATISGTVFNDTNGDGVQDDGETGIAGFGVYLDLDNSGTYVDGDPVPTTDANGNYTFADLPAGTYIVRVALPANYVQTAPSHDYGRHVTLADGQQLSGVDFGDQLIAT